MTLASSAFAIATMSLIVSIASFARSGRVPVLDVHIEVRDERPAGDAPRKPFAVSVSKRGAA